MNKKEFKTIKNVNSSKDYFLFLCNKLSVTFEKEEQEKDIEKLTSYFLKDIASIQKDIDFEDEKMLRKSILKYALKKIFVELEKLNVDEYLHEKEFNSFLISIEFTELMFAKLLKETKDEYFIQISTEKNNRVLMGNIKSELPLILQRIFDIETGSYIKNDGSAMTLKEYASLTNQDLNKLKELFSSAKKLMEVKISNYGIKIERDV